MTKARFGYSISLDEQEQTELESIREKEGKKLGLKEIYRKGIEFFKTKWEM